MLLVNQYKKSLYLTWSVSSISSYPSGGGFLDLRIFGILNQNVKILNYKKFLVQKYIEDKRLLI